MNKEFEFRNFDTSDLAAILDIEQTTHSNPWSGKFFHKQLTNSARAILLKQNAEIISYLVYQQVVDEAEILNLATAAKHQNQGCASLLLRRFLDILETSGVKRVYLEVANDNLAAIALYTARLFKQDGIRKDYYQRKHGRCDAILMSRSLK